MGKGEFICFLYSFLLYVGFDRHSFVVFSHTNIIVFISNETTSIALYTTSLIMVPVNRFPLVVNCVHNKECVYILKKSDMGGNIYIETGLVNGWLYTCAHIYIMGVLHPSKIACLHLTFFFTHKLWIISVLLWCCRSLWSRHNATRARFCRWSTYG